MNHASAGQEMEFIFITDVPELAAYVEQFGVGTIMVDLEIHGKAERQRGRNTLISCHRPEAVPALRAALKTAKLMVRVNPLHARTLREVDACLDSGADLLMLPMFRKAAEVAQFCRYVDGRAGVVPLVETVGATRDLVRVVRVDGISRIHIGLNDLHLDLGRKFLFEPLADGMVDGMAECCRRAGRPFGVGGVSMVGHGLVPGEMVLGEHARLGSSGVILSRSFHQDSQNLQQLQCKMDFPGELERLRQVYQRHLRRTVEQIDRDCREFCGRVARVVAESA